MHSRVVPSIVVPHQPAGLEKAEGTRGRVGAELVDNARLPEVPAAFGGESDRLVEQIDLALAARSATVVALTGAGCRDGVTTIACALALSLVQRHRGRVLMIDANPQAPLGGGARRGLVDLLTGTAGIDEAVCRAQGSELWVLPWGRTDADVSGQVDAAAIAALYKALRAQFACVVIDLASPADNPFSTRLAAAADGVAVVVASHGTDRGRLSDTVDMLRRAGATLLGVVMNERHAGR